jgi:hypothetical protein
MSIRFHLALLLAAAAPLAHAQLGLGLAPMKLELKMSPGQVYSNTLKLSSGAGDKLRVRGESLDFQIDDKDTPQFERSLPGEAAFSCRKWLTLNPTEIELDKEAFVLVRYSMHLPADVPEGSYACAAGFTTLPSAQSMQQGVGMRMAVRIVATFYVQVGSPAIDGSLKQLNLERLPGTPSSASGLQAVAVIENSGRMYFRPTGKLDILDVDGKTVETADFASLPVLREREQRFVFPLKKTLASGKYQLRARVDLGLKEMQQASVDVVIDGPSDNAPTAQGNSRVAGTAQAPGAQR